MSGLINTVAHKIAWGECDPAGIVFYPNYLAMFDNATGALFARTGLSPSAMREKYNIAGMPLVEQSARFLLPCRFDEDIVIESDVVEWGRASFKVRHRIKKDGALAVEGFEKRVWAAHDKEQPGKLISEPIPAEIVACLSDAAGGSPVKR